MLLGLCLKKINAGFTQRARDFDTLFTIGQVKQRWQKIDKQLDGSQGFIRVDDFLFRKLAFPTSMSGDSDPNDIGRLGKMPLESIKPKSPKSLHFQ
jgi:hypothetical protein